MNASEFPDLNARRAAPAGDASGAPGADPSTFIPTLRRIQRGAAADGQPWPERAVSPGRRLQLADADCALAGLATVQQMLLAAERTRQTALPEDTLGDRSTEGLLLACIALTAHAANCLQVQP